MHVRTYYQHSINKPSHDFRETQCDNNNKVRHIASVTAIVIISHRDTEGDGILLAVDVAFWFVHVCAFFASPRQAFDRFLNTK